MDEGNANTEKVSCGDCGAENLQNALFCAECGSDLKSKVTSGNICPKCSAPNVDGAKFCAECGTDVLSVSQKAALYICPKCGFENPENSKFCAECGKLMPVDETQLSTTNVCPECGCDNPDNSQFCAECGKTLPLINTSSETVCPKCGAMNVAGAVFCAECGKELFKQKSTNSHKNKRAILEGLESKPLEERKKRSFDNKSSGGLGGLLGSKSSLTKGLGKALSGIEEKTQPHLNKIDDTLNDLQNKKEEEHYGYLVCDSCSGYYELQKGESIDDFEGCGCGGNFSFSQTLP